jgi:glycerol uptake facilitator-like aquaporin
VSECRLPFANPAVTLARGFTTTFAGIAINHVPGFIMVQLVGAAIGAHIAATLSRSAPLTLPNEAKRPVREAA